MMRQYDGVFSRIWSVEAGRGPELETRPRRRDRTAAILTLSGALSRSEVTYHDASKHELPADEMYCTLEDDDTGPAFRLSSEETQVSRRWFEKAAAVEEEQVRRRRRVAMANPTFLSLMW